MAFTFGTPVTDEYGVTSLTATTDTSSAAGSFTLGFVPNEVIVYNTTTPVTHRWTYPMTAGTANKVVAAGTQTTAGSNGVTVTGPNSTPPVQPTVLLGTDLHVNSASYVIVCRK